MPPSLCILLLYYSMLNDIWTRYFDSMTNCEKDCLLGQTVLPTGLFVTARIIEHIKFLMGCLHIPQPVLKWGKEKYHFSRLLGEHVQWSQCICCWTIIENFGRVPSISFQSSWCLYSLSKLGPKQEDFTVCRALCEDFEILVVEGVLH